MFSLERYGGACVHALAPETPEALLKRMLESFTGWLPHPGGAHTAIAALYPVRLVRDSAARACYGHRLRRL